MQSWKLFAPKLSSAAAEGIFCAHDKRPHSYDSQFPLRYKSVFKCAESLPLGFQTKLSFVVLML